jgi:hypothetical protein
MSPCVFVQEHERMKLEFERQQRERGRARSPATGSVAVTAEPHMELDAEQPVVKTFSQAKDRIR